MNLKNIKYKAIKYDIIVLLADPANIAGSTI